jgi:hypothetical protein
MGVMTVVDRIQRTRCAVLLVLGSWAIPWAAFGLDLESGLVAWVLGALIEGVLVCLVAVVSLSMVRRRSRSNWGVVAILVIGIAVHLLYVEPILTASRLTPSAALTPLMILVVLMLLCIEVASMLKRDSE